MDKDNVDLRTVASFGDEWMRFDQAGMPEGEAHKVFGEYFRVFPWESLPPDSEGFDMGCGSGRWARLVAPRVGRLHCIEPSAALDVARANLADVGNVVFHEGSVSAPGLEPESQDFGYALGVLHHVPDTAGAIRACARLLKPGAPFLLYLYYAFDNRPWWFRALWRASDFGRRAICRMPPWAKGLATDAIAVLIYWPLARIGLLVNRLGISMRNWPLSYYRHHGLYTMRTDSRDRFGTPLEQRFTRTQISAMMESAGLVGVTFSEHAPYWCAVGWRPGKIH